MKRLIALILACLTLSACALQPMYAGGSSGVVAQGLGAIEVPPIEGKAGWLMRNDLNDRLRQSGTHGTPRYRLDVLLDDKLEG
ncbi:MAG: LPS assembly lipoprotein LptE, partial [Tsuneonella sp.]